MRNFLSLFKRPVMRLFDEYVAGDGDALEKLSRQPIGRRDIECVKGAYDRLLCRSQVEKSAEAQRRYKRAERFLDEISEVYNRNLDTSRAAFAVH